MARRPLLTYTLILTNTAVFLWAVINGVNGALIERYAFSLPRLLAGRFETVVVAGSLHAGPAHLLYNMVFLLIFGTACERAFGRLRTAAIYLSGLVAGSLFFAMLFADAKAVGASGAVFAVMAAAMLVDPRRPLHPRLPLPIGFIGVAYLIPALANAFETASGVANIAHVGGAVAGGILAYAWRPRQVARSVWVVLGFAALLFVLGL